MLIVIGIVNFNIYFYEITKVTGKIVIILLGLHILKETQPALKTVLKYTIHQYMYLGTFEVEI